MGIDTGPSERDWQSKGPKWVGSFRVLVLMTEVRPDSETLYNLNMRKTTKNSAQNNNFIWDDFDYTGMEVSGKDTFSIHLYGIYLFIVYLTML
jgi:hypothetical protein